MPALASFADERLQALATNHLTRRASLGTRPEALVVERDGERYSSFSCNNYFGLTHHPQVIATAQAALAEAGSGAAASRLVTGGQDRHRALEQSLAEWKGYEDAALFGSGYLANLGTLTALMGRGDLILLDKLSHACLIDGARLSGAAFLRFAHNDMADLERLLVQQRGTYRHCLIVSESLFSMDGDRAPTADIAKLACAHDTWWMLDDAHGLGEEMTPKPDLLTGSLSKALGSYGGYTLTSQPVAELLRSTARSLVFSTALPPADVAAAQAALELVRAHPAWRLRALQHAEHFCAALALPQPQSQIVPIILGDAETALAAAAQLKDQGLLVSAIRPPTVAQGTARLRLSFSSAHRDHDVDRLIAAMAGLLSRQERRYG